MHLLSATNETENSVTRAGERMWKRGTRQYTLTVRLSLSLSRIRNVCLSQWHHTTIVRVRRSLDSNDLVANHRVLSFYYLRIQPRCNSTLDRSIDRASPGLTYKIIQLISSFVGKEKVCFVSSVKEAFPLFQIERVYKYTSYNIVMNEGTS